MKLLDYLAKLSLCLAFACSVMAASAQSWPENPSQDWTDLIARATEEGGIVVVGNAEIDDGLLAAFTEDTGIPAISITGARNETQARVTREIETNQATFDIYLGGRTSYEFSDKGLLAAVKPMLILPEVTDGSHWLGGEMQWVDSAKTYLPLPAAYVSGFVLVNTDRIDPANLTTWDDLLDPALAAQLAIYDVTVRGSGISVATYLAEVKGADYLKTLLGTQVEGITKDYRQLTDWVARGTYAVALGPRSVDIDRYLADGVDNLAVVKMTDAPGYVSGGAAVMAIPAEVPHPAGAQVFANWFLSQRGQQVYSRVASTPSYRTDVVREGWPDYIAIVPGETYVNQYNQDWAITSEPKFAAIVADAMKD